jgi:hypothetical protein
MVRRNGAAAIDAAIDETERAAAPDLAEQTFIQAYNRLCLEHGIQLVPTVRKVAQTWGSMTAHVDVAGLQTAPLTPEQAGQLRQMLGLAAGA